MDSSDIPREQRNSHGNQILNEHYYSDTEAILETVTIITIGTISILGNTLTLIAVAKFRNLRTASNIFVANLAITDGVLGAVLCFLPINILGRG